MKRAEGVQGIFESSTQSLRSHEDSGKEALSSNSQVGEEGMGLEVTSNPLEKVREAVSNHHDICGMSDDNFLYPLGTCTKLLGSSYQGGVVYSAHQTTNQFKLELKPYVLPDCSDVGGSLMLAMALNKTCTSNLAESGSMSGTSLPPLTQHHRYISFYADKGCNNNVLEVYHLRDGCAPIPGGGYAKFQCQSDGSSKVQLLGTNDNLCSASAITPSFTMQPSSCTAVGGVYMTTSCVP